MNRFVVFHFPFYFARVISHLAMLFFICTGTTEERRDNIVQSYKDSHLNVINYAVGAIFGIFVSSSGLVLHLHGVGLLLLVEYGNVEFVCLLWGCACNSVCAIFTFTHSVDEFRPLFHSTQNKCAENWLQVTPNLHIVLCQREK